MQTFSFKSQFGFEPRAAAVPVDAVNASAYATPAAFQESLDDLARLSYLKGALRYKVAQSAKPAAGAATLKLTDGVTDYASVALALSSAAVLTGALDVDLSAISGQTKLQMVLDVTTAADAGTTASVDAQMEVTMPLMLSGC